MWCRPEGSVTPLWANRFSGFNDSIVLVLPKSEVELEVKLKSGFKAVKILKKLDWKYKT